MNLIDHVAEAFITRLIGLILLLPPPHCPRFLIALLYMGDGFSHYKVEFGKVHKLNQTVKTILHT